MPSLTSNWATVMAAKYVYMGIVKRSEFDLIDLPATDHGIADPDRPVLTKTARDPSGCTVVFQHWYGPSPSERMAQDLAAQALARVTVAQVSA